MTTTHEMYNTIAYNVGEGGGDIGRQRRGLAIAAQCEIRRVPNGWLVPAQSGEGSYTCTLDWCPCEDYRKRQLPCKHIYAARITAFKSAGGTKLSDFDPARTYYDLEPMSLDSAPQLVVPSKPELAVPAHMVETCPQSPPQSTPKTTLYDKVQENEARHFIRLLWDLTQTVDQPYQHMGRKRRDIQKILFAMVHRAYTTKSGRRGYGETALAADVLGIDDLPSRSTVSRYMTDPDMMPMLVHLLETSAVPVAPIETDFAMDSTGFGTSIKDQTWAEHKWGSEASKSSNTGTIWTKAHFSVGVNTLIISAAVVTESLHDSGDITQYPLLLAATNRHFQISTVYADGAYLSEDSIFDAKERGIRLYVPFRKNSVYHDPVTPAGREWNRMLAYFRDHSSDWYQNYNTRSVVESGMASVKKLMRHLTRGLKPDSRVNEVLCKAVAHNIVRVIHASHMEGIEPCFGDKG